MPRYLIFLTSVFVLLIGYSWYWVAYHPMAFLEGDYANWKAKGDMLDRCEVGTLAFIGDSSAVHAIGPNLIGPGTVNLATIASKPAEVMAISRRILSCKVLPKAVILTLNFDNFHSGVGCCFWEHAVRFDVLNITLNDLESFRHLARHYEDIDMFGPPSFDDIDARLKNHLYTIKFPSYYFAALISGGFNSRLRENKQYYMETLRDKGQHNFATNHGNWKLAYADWEHFIMPSPLQEYFFDQMLKLYQAHNIPLYYIGPPYKEGDIKVFPPRVRQEFETFLEGYEKRYPNFHVLGDLFHPLPNDDFGDDVHVNHDGTVAWSAYLKELLTQNHIEH